MSESSARSQTELGALELAHGDGVVVVVVMVDHHLGRVRGLLRVNWSNRVADAFWHVFP